MGVCLTADSEDAHTSCRICFEEAPVEDLISPCKCKGSLQFVHPRCLERWQRSVLKLGKANDERAVRCGVCCTRYSHLPRRLALRSAANTALRSLFGAGCLTLLALGVAGPPHLHLLCILVLLLSVRSQHLAAVVLVAAICMLGMLYLRGLRLVVRTGGNRELGLALIRYGAPVSGLSSGVLLLASADLDGTPFARSVVLVTQHGRRGAQGVMLTQPLAPSDTQAFSSSTPIEGSGSPATAAATAAVRHYMGGPVGYQAHRGDPAQVLVLHQLQGLPGAHPILQPAAVQSTPGAAVQSTGSSTAAGAVQAAATEVAQPAAGRRAAAASELQRQMVEAYRRLGRPAVRSMTVNGSPPGVDHGLPPPGSAGAGAGHIGGIALPAAATGTGGHPGQHHHQQQQQQQQQGSQAPSSRTHSRRDQSSTSTSSSGNGIRFSWFHRPSLRRRRREDRSTPAAAASSGTQSGQPAGSTAVPPLLGPGLYSGGSLEEALRLAGALKLTGQLAGHPLIHMYHGMCTWASGQLEGEVRQGAWGFIPAASAQDVVGVPPSALYGRLLQHGGLKWM